MLGITTHRLRPFALMLSLIAFFCFGLNIYAKNDFTISYSSSQNLLSGTLVQLDETSPKKIIRVDQASEEKLAGVAIRSGDSKEITGHDPSAYYIATTGEFKVLVSDINGTISKGDKLALSIIPGVAVLANGTQQILVGTAKESFNGSAKGTLVIDFDTVTDKEGQKVKVSVGKIAVDIQIGPNPNAVYAGILPGFIVNLAESIGGKTNISETKIYISLALLVIASAVSGSMVLAGYKKAATLRELELLARKPAIGKAFVVSGSGALVFLIALTVIWLILKS